MNRFALLILFVLLLGTPMLAQSGRAAGTWDVTLNSPQGSFNIQFNLKQDGEKVVGVVKAPGAEVPLEGTLKAKDIVLKWTAKFQGSDLPIALTGVLDGDAMKGSADYGGFAQGDFTAKRAAEATAVTPLPAPASTASAKPDISGAWQFHVETPNGSGTPTFTFKQEGEKLSGQYKGAFGEAPLSGTVKENKVEFSIKVQVQGEDVTITYTGTVEKDGTMKGTASLGEASGITWTAKRQ